MHSDSIRTPTAHQQHHHAEMSNNNLYPVPPSYSPISKSLQSLRSQSSDSSDERKIYSLSNLKDQNLKNSLHSVRSKDSYLLPDSPSRSPTPSISISGHHGAGHRRGSTPSSAHYGRSVSPSSYLDKPHAVSRSGSVHSVHAKMNGRTPNQMTSSPPSRRPSQMDDDINSYYGSDANKTPSGRNTSPLSFRLPAPAMNLIDKIDALRAEQNILKEQHNLHCSDPLNCNFPQEH